MCDLSPMNPYVAQLIELRAMHDKVEAALAETETLATPATSDAAPSSATPAGVAGTHSMETTA